MDLKDLKVYGLARQVSSLAWEIYNNLHWEDRKVIGHQFIRSIDSVGANIAEGFGRYHYSDKAKFYYNARGSLSEACEHWLELLWERSKISQKQYENIKSISKNLTPQLNNLINSTYQQKEK